jgi:hypothetical protein
MAREVIVDYKVIDTTDYVVKEEEAAKKPEYCDQNKHTDAYDAGGYTYTGYQGCWDLCPDQTY